MINASLYPCQEDPRLPTIAVRPPWPQSPNDVGHSPGESYPHPTRPSSIVLGEYLAIIWKRKETWGSHVVDQGCCQNGRMAVMWRTNQKSCAVLVTWDWPAPRWSGSISWKLDACWILKMIKVIIFDCEICSKSCTQTFGDGPYYGHIPIYPLPGTKQRRVVHRYVILQRQLQA